ncbi:MAG: hypothetical protein U0X58_12255 [Flavobacteriaceae bacterium]
MGAQIFKSAWRTVKQSDESLTQSLSINSVEIPISLSYFDEIFLRPQAKYIYPLKEQSECLLLPLSGAIDFISGNLEGFVHIGQLQIIASEQTSTCVISNPYPDDTVHFLAIQQPTSSNKSSLSAFDLSKTNQIIPIATNSLCSLSIGMFEGRADDTYRLSSDENTLMVFVIRGAFEFQNRLLEAGDTLILDQTHAAEFEALSNNALLLFIENFTSKK